MSQLLNNLTPNEPKTAKPNNDAICSVGLIPTLTNEIALPSAITIKMHPITAQLDFVFEKNLVNAINTSAITSIQSADSKITSFYTSNITTPYVCNLTPHRGVSDDWLYLSEAKMPSVANHS